MEKNKLIVPLLILLLTIGLVSASTNVDFDVGAGEVIVDVDSSDSSVHFYGNGQYQGYMDSVESGNYLDTDVLVESISGANLFFSGEQELSGYTSNSVGFESFAYGSNALLNNRFDNSNYVVQFERVDTSKDLLRAGGSSYGIGYSMNVNDGESESAFASVELYGNGVGLFDTNQWHSTSIGSYGWGNPDSISSPSKPGYYTPTNIVSATGSGQFVQTGKGDNSLEMNGFVMGSGWGQFVANFEGGITGAFSNYAN